jgi:hypothetical protein
MKRQCPKSSVRPKMRPGTTGVRHDYERALISALNEDVEDATDGTHEFREGCLCRDCLEEAIDRLADRRSVLEAVASRINVCGVNETGNSATIDLDSDAGRGGLRLG